MRLREQSRRQICQLAFVALCLGPTAAVLAIGVARRMPSHTAAYVDALRDQLGLGVSLRDASHPRPNLLLFHDIELTDPETGELVLKCRMLEASSGGTFRVFKAAGVEMHADAVEHVWRLLERTLRGQMPGATGPVRLLADTLTWNGPQRSQTFTDVMGQLGSGPQGMEATLSFRIVGTEMPEPATIRVVRHGGEQPSTALALNTGSTPLPCQIFAPLLSSVDWLGSRAAFHGYLWAQESSHGWDGELTGQLSDLDLDASISEHFPHTLSGSVNVQLERARFQQGRMVEAIGAVTGAGGTISRSLLAAGQRCLNLDAETDTASPELIVRYRRLAFDFILDAEGLKLIGRCPSRQRGTLLADEWQRSLWIQPALQPQPAVNLVRALAPENDIQVPASEVTERLLRHLPLPPLRAPAGADRMATPPRAKLRPGATPGLLR
jgi:hypothetical protein